MARSGSEWRSLKRESELGGGSRFIPRSVEGGREAHSTLATDLVTDLEKVCIPVSAERA